MNKPSSFLLALTIIAATIIAPTLSKVAAEELNPIYGGTAVDNDVIASHGIKFSIENDSVLYSVLGDITLEFYAYQDFSDNSQTLMAAVYTVSYKASWLDKPVSIYQWSIHDPTILRDDDPNPKGVFRYKLDLTNVSKGEHQIEVTATGGGYLWVINPSSHKAYYVTFTKTSSASLNFTIDTSPTATPDSDSGILWKADVT